MNEITINVVIADRNYTIIIDRSEEEQIRKAVKDINDKTKKFSQLYNYKDNQDLLAMTSLQISTENIKHVDSQINNTKKTEERIKDITVLVDTYLNK